MARSKLWIGLAVLFLAGVLTGVVGTCVYHEREEHQRWERGPAARQERIMKRLTRELDLTRGQQTLVESIVRRTHLEILRVRFQHQAEIESILAKAIADLKIELGPEQDAKLDELYVKVRRRWDASREYLRAAEQEPKKPD